MRSINSLNIGDRADPSHPFHQPFFDDIKDHMGILTRHEANQLACYMDFFRDHKTTYMSYPADPFDPSVTINLNGGEDGEYRWSGLTHYLIKKYRVDPPMVFREHVRLQLASGIDLEALTKELQRPANSEDAKVQNRRRPFSPAGLREREWRRVKEEGGISAAWALYP